MTTTEKEYHDCHGGLPSVELVVASPSLVKKIIDEVRRRARELLRERFGVAS